MNFLDLVSKLKAIDSINESVDSVCEVCGENCHCGEDSVCEVCGESRELCECDMQILEAEAMSPAQLKKREEIVLAMKKDTAGLKERYGKRWKEVMYRTATKQAKETVKENCIAPVNQSEEMNDTHISTSAAAGTTYGNPYSDKSISVTASGENADHVEQALKSAGLAELIDHDFNDDSVISISKTVSSIRNKREKQLSVSASNTAASELEKVLANAGIKVDSAVTPMSKLNSEEMITLEEGAYANSPDPQELDAETQLVTMSGGLNKPKQQYTNYRMGDNTITTDQIVTEATRRLAESLQHKFRAKYGKNQ